MQPRPRPQLAGLVVPQGPAGGMAAEGTELEGARARQRGRRAVRDGRSARSLRGAPRVPGGAPGAPQVAATVTAGRADSLAGVEAGRCRGDHGDQPAARRSAAHRCWGAGGRARRAAPRCRTAGRLTAGCEAARARGRSAGLADQRYRQSPGRSKSSSGVVLARRRAALTIDDYRRVGCHSAPENAIGLLLAEPAARRAYQRAERAIGEVAEQRLRRHHGRGR